MMDRAGLSVKRQKMLHSDHNPYDVPTETAAQQATKPNRMAIISFGFTIAAAFCIVIPVNQWFVFGAFLAVPGFVTAVLSLCSGPSKLAVVSLCLSSLLMLYLPTLIRVLLLLFGKAKGDILLLL